ncbi:hypothetical protein G4Y79_00995 [Phototrophicus methaneseepsis]|uniref:Uncharacterized protein n=1 Tax=Phototrophicus methaneseepsis TaxID=2710758 RepID=A0A7S8E9T7_9CHLR|nr:hypothetical protein [Phototrophicus methaneseepsis]QPC82982.1 hypothetical protein G4Y79_00995 [Phototrophicus methaneseepsis]
MKSLMKPLMDYLVPRLYAFMLRFYPRPFREQFTEEMTYVFQQAWDQSKQQGLFRRISFYLREMTGLLVSILNAQLSAHSDMTFYGLISKPRRIIPLLVCLCALVAGAASLHRWGYLFVPPSTAVTTSPFKTVSGVHFVQYGPGYQATEITQVNLPMVTLDDYPPSRVLPRLRDRYQPATTQVSALSAQRVEQIAQALSAQNIALVPLRTSIDTPLLYCTDNDTCYEDWGDLPQGDRFFTRLGRQLQPDGSLMITSHVQTHVSRRTADGRTQIEVIDTGETRTSTVWPQDGIHYFYHFLPSGFIIEGTGYDGEPLILTNLTNHLSNDHYGYYEILYEVGQGELIERARVQYNYDISGLEGFTTLVLLLGLLVPALALWLIVLLVWRIIRFLNPAQHPRKFAT